MYRVLRLKEVPKGLENEFVQKVLYRRFVNVRLHLWCTHGIAKDWLEDKSSTLQNGLMTYEELINNQWWYWIASLTMISQNPKAYICFGVIIDSDTSSLALHMMFAFAYVFFEFSQSNQLSLWMQNSSCNWLQSS